MQYFLDTHPEPKFGALICGAFSTRTFVDESLWQFEPNYKNGADIREQTYEIKFPKPKVDTMEFGEVKMTMCGFKVDPDRTVSEE